MPMVKVRCKTCSALIPTGLDLDVDALKDLTYTDRSVECPVCESMQTWGMQDVDASAFRKTPE